MEFLFDHKREINLTRIASENISEYAQTPAEVIALCESIKDYDFKVEGIKPMLIGFSATNETPNEEGRYNDCFYTSYMAQDYNGMKKAISSLSKEFAERVCALMTSTDTIRTKYVTTFYAPRFSQAKPITGYVRFYFTILGEGHRDSINRLCRPVKREYKIEFTISELPTEQKIF